MGNRFYGAFSSFFWKYIHTPSCRLCIKTACPKNDANTIVGFLQRNVLRRFGTPRTIISDGGSHFANKVFDKLMSRYDIKHIMSLAYHPQTKMDKLKFPTGR